MQGEEVKRLPLPLHPADLRRAVNSGWTVHVVCTEGPRVDDVQVFGSPETVEAFNTAMLADDPTPWLRAYVARLALE